ncbi:PIN domain-containing protein [Candidatus Micrarchaeota archaeon]|nr:PIN domain-containing protein [Candidatus Micrarchaeota archaeon]
MYFCDTYALIEYVKSNHNYADIMNSSSITISDFQLMETYYFILRDLGEDAANKVYETFSQFRVDIPEQIIKRAMKLRLEFHKERKRISYVDAIGYAYALEKNLLFLTGDREFKNLPNVKWIASD